jgi:hypothetical protein
VLMMMGEEWEIEENGILLSQEGACSGREENNWDAGATKRRTKEPGYFNTPGSTSES